MLQKGLAFLARGRFLGDTLRLVVGTAVGQVISIIAAPVLTRLYTPEQFGIFSVYTVIVSTASVLACLSYETAIMLPKDDREATQILAASLMLAFFMAGLSSAMVFLFGKKLVEFVKAPELLSILWWAPLNLFAVGAYQALSYWNTRRRQFGRLSVSRISQSGGTAAIQIGAGLAGGGASGLVYGQIFGQVMASSVLAVDAAKSRVWSLGGEWPNPLQYAVLLFRYRNFPLYSTWGTLMNTAAFQCVPLLLFTLFGPAVAGFYFVAFRLVNVPMSLVGAAAGRVLFQRATAELLQERSLSRLVVRAVGRSLALWAIPFLVVALLAPKAFSIFLGPDWVTAGHYVQVLIPLFFSQLITSPVSVVLIALEKQFVLAALQGLLLVGAVGSLAVAGHVFASPITSLAVYAACQSVVYMLYLSAIIRYSSASVRAIAREATSFKSIVPGLD